MSVTWAPRALLAILAGVEDEVGYPAKFYRHAKQCVDDGGSLLCLCTPNTQPDPVMYLRSCGPGLLCRLALVGLLEPGHEAGAELGGWYRYTPEFPSNLGKS